MAEKDFKKFKFSRRSCMSRALGHQPVKVVHFQNPTMVKTTAVEFRSVVQFHTGRRKRSATDRHESTPMKAPKLEATSEYNFNPMSKYGSDTYGDCDINSQELKRIETQWENISDILNKEIFDTVDSVGNGFCFGQFSPIHFYD